MSISVGQKWGKCATILPSIFQEKDRIQFWDKVFINSKEFMSGYIATTIDILKEETCMNDLRFREMKEDVKNIFCTVKLEEKVRMIL